VLGLLSKNWPIFYESVNDITIVSEPATLLLLGLGAVMLRRKGGVNGV
jgi:hypothetical protein